MNRASLQSAVGLNQLNLVTDVRLIQQLLNKHSFVTRKTLAVDGNFGQETLSALLAFQRKVLVMHLPDGVVNVFGLTIDRLEKSSIKPMTAPIPVPATQASTSGLLTDSDYQQAATTLGCEVAVIKAVAAVETGKRGAFDSEGRPIILFERHFFSRLTNHLYDKSNPDISNKKQGGYGKFSEQYPKLNRAYVLDQDAALRSASWGAFQIMGDNYEVAGFKSAADFVAAMRRSVGDQLQAFVNFIRSNPRLANAIRTRNWALFAAGYNGPAYKENDYDTKLAEAYAQNSK